ncbi:MAG: sodium:proton antiporter [Microcoleus sp. SIO2G3]|nr:sodium:proton antiporter [Microcoleus sp. SIO2G3]
MTFSLLYVIIGTLLIVMALTSSVLKRLPLSTSLLYLGVGVGSGPIGIGLIRLDPIESAPLLERLTEVAIVVSLFTTGLKLRARLSSARWGAVLRLAVGSMTLTVLLIALVGVVGLHLLIGAALLGGILAPTDPVLASDVEVEDPWDCDRVRFSLTGEAALNDGSNSPFIFLGLGLLGLHELESGWQWLAADVVWATCGGLAIGALLGTLVGKLVLYLRREHKEAIGLDDFLALGLIALSYGIALLVHAYGFLAVFAAGLALRHIELQSTGETPPAEVMAMTRSAAEFEVASDPEAAPAFMAQAVLGFNEPLGRIGEVAIVLLLGSILTPDYLSREALWFVPLLLLVIRPISVGLGLIGSCTSGLQRVLITWFGIRGIAAIYYTMYALDHGLPSELAQPLTALALTTVAASIVVHGISVSPLMNFYSSKTALSEELLQQQ